MGEVLGWSGEANQGDEDEGKAIREIGDLVGFVGAGNDEKEDLN